MVILVAQPCLAATTELTITKYASDRVTILNQTTKDYTWLAANLPVFGNGYTHYYMQGPIFIDYPSNETWNRNYGGIFLKIQIVILRKKIWVR